MASDTSPIIENFRKHLSPENLRNLGVSEWKEIISGELSQIFSTRTYSFNPVYLYRARLNFDSNGKAVEFFDNVKDLWAPPYKNVKKQGRCNMPRQSLLYCSTNPTTTLFELSPETDVEKTVIEYKCIDEIKNLAIIGVNEVVSVANDYGRIFGNHFNGRKEETILLDEMLSLIFRGKTRNTQTIPIYNLTNAITQIFLNKQPRLSPFGTPLPPTNVGLIYPSVETSQPLGANLVLDPFAVKEHLKPSIAYKYKIIRKYSADFFDILQTHKTSKIYPNGQMVWESCYDSKIEHITHLPTTRK
jgi:hypothetical protein